MNLSPLCPYSTFRQRENTEVYPSGDSATFLLSPNVASVFIPAICHTVGCWSLTLALLAGVRARCGSTADLEQRLYDQMTQRTLDAVALFVYQKAFFLALYDLT